MQVLVGLSGLWINKKYIHLAASPDGLVFSDDKNLLKYCGSQVLKHSKTTQC